MINPTSYSQLVKEFIIVNVYKHSLPRLNDCPLADNQCAGCQLSLAPSSSYQIVSLCETALGYNHDAKLVEEIVIGNPEVDISKSYGAA